MSSNNVQYENSGIKISRLPQVSEILQDSLFIISQSENNRYVSKKIKYNDIFDNINENIQNSIINIINTNTTTISNDINGVKNDILTAQVDIGYNRDKIIEIDSVINDVNRNVNNHTIDINNINTNIQQIQTNTRTNSNEINTIKSNIDIAKKNIDSNQISIRENKNNIDTIQNNVNDIQNKNEALDEKLNNIKIISLNYETGFPTDFIPHNPESKIYFGEKLSFTIKDQISKNGYTFTGWKINEEIYQPNDIIYLDETTTATAQFTEHETKTIILSYDTNGGSGEFQPQSITVAEGDSARFTLYSHIPIKIDPSENYTYDFIGWKINDTTYSSGQSIVLDSNATATAVWNETIKTTFAITYHSNEQNTIE